MNKEIWLTVGLTSAALLGILVVYGKWIKPTIEG